MNDISVDPKSPAITVDYPMFSLSRLDQSGLGAMRRLVHRVCRAAGVGVSGVMSERRYRSFSVPRQVIYWLAHRDMGYSLTRIGTFMHRDHSTVMHGILKVDQALRQGDRRYTDIIAEAMKGDA